MGVAERRSESFARTDLVDHGEDRLGNEIGPIADHGVLRPVDDDVPPTRGEHGQFVVIRLFFSLIRARCGLGPGRQDDEGHVLPQSGFTDLKQAIVPVQIAIDEDTYGRPCQHLLASKFAQLDRQANNATETRRCITQE